MAVTMTMTMNVANSLRWILLAGALTFLACDRDKETAQVQAPPTPGAADTASPALTFPPDSGPPPVFDGDRAMQYVKDIVKFGPRPLGSANHKKVEDYFVARLKGDM